MPALHQLLPMSDVRPQLRGDLEGCGGRWFKRRSVPRLPEGPEDGGASEAGATDCARLPEAVRDLQCQGRQCIFLGCSGRRSLVALELLVPRIVDIKMT
jgi:hypothetical protein